MGRHLLVAMVAAVKAMAVEAMAAEEATAAARIHEVSWQISAERHLYGRKLYGHQKL